MCNVTKNYTFLYTSRSKEFCYSRRDPGPCTAQTQKGTPTCSGHNIVSSPDPIYLSEDGLHHDQFYVGSGTRLHTLSVVFPRIVKQ